MYDGQFRLSVLFRFFGLGDFFGSEIPDIAEVNIDLLRRGFAVLCRSFVDNDSLYECA